MVNINFVVFVSRPDAPHHRHQMMMISGSRYYLIRHLFPNPITALLMCCGFYSTATIHHHNNHTGAEASSATEAAAASTHRIPQEIIKVRSCIFVFFFAFQYTHPHPPTSPRKNNIANRTKEGAIYIYIIYSFIVVDSSPRNRSTITKQFLWHPPAYALANFFPPKRDSTQTPPPIIVNFFFCAPLSIIAEFCFILHPQPNQRQTMIMI